MDLMKWCKTDCLDVSHTHVLNCSCHYQPHTAAHTTNMHLHLQHEHIRTHWARWGPGETRLRVQKVSNGQTAELSAADVCFTGNQKVMNQNKGAFLFFPEYRLKSNL